MSLGQESQLGQRQNRVYLQRVSTEIDQALRETSAASTVLDLSGFAIVAIITSLVIAD